MTRTDKPTTPPEPRATIEVPLANMARLMDKQASLADSVEKIVLAGERLALAVRRWQDAEPRNMPAFAAAEAAVFDALIDYEETVAGRFDPRIGVPAYLVETPR